MKRIIKALVASALAASGLLVPMAAVALTSNPVGKNPFNYDFHVNGTLVEAGNMSGSSSPYFWLNSGAYFTLKDGVGKTYHGSLVATNVWRLLYLDDNAQDTGNGYYPQNLFRMVTKHTWNNFTEEVRFKLDKVNLTDTPERDGWSGVLFFSRYNDGNNLYYIGIRMDGKAVIKKKLNGTYYTLGEYKVFPGTYNRDSNPNLIPMNQWMRMKATTVTNGDGSVTITMSIDKADTGAYTQVLSVTDRAGANGSSVIKGPAYAGLRTDYLDVSFDDYKFTEL